MINPPKRSYTGLSCLSSTAVTNSHSTVFSSMTTAIAGRQVNNTPTHHTTRPSSLPAYAGGVNGGTVPFVNREIGGAELDATLDLFARRTVVGASSSPFSIGPSSPLGLLISQTELNYCDVRSTSTLATPPTAYGQDLPDEHHDVLDTAVEMAPQNTLLNVPASPDPLAPTTVAQCTSNTSINGSTQDNDNSESYVLSARADNTSSYSNVQTDTTSITSISTNKVTTSSSPTSLTVHFPDLCARPDGMSFRLDLTNHIRLPATTDTKPWDHHLHLTDVIVTLVNQTGGILYHKCHFSGASLLPEDPLHYFHHKSWDDFVHPGDTDLWNRHQSKAFNESRLGHKTIKGVDAVTTSNGLCLPDVSTTSTERCDSEEGLPTLRILDCPNYRVRFGSQTFRVHTFSLPASRELPRGVATWTSVNVDGAAGSSGTFVVHYHRLIREHASSDDRLAGFYPSTMSNCTTLALPTPVDSRLMSITASPTLSRTSTMDSTDDLDVPSTTYLHHHRPCAQLHELGCHQNVLPHQHPVNDNDLLDSCSPTVTYHHHHHHAHHHHHHHRPQITGFSTTPASPVCNTSPLKSSPSKVISSDTDGSHTAMSFLEPSPMVTAEPTDRSNPEHCHHHHHRHHHGGHGPNTHHHHHYRHHIVTHDHVSTPVNKETTFIRMTNDEHGSTPTSVSTTSTRHTKPVVPSYSPNGMEPADARHSSCVTTQSVFGSVERRSSNPMDSSTTGSPFQTGQPTCLVTPREAQPNGGRRGHSRIAPPPRSSPVTNSIGQSSTVSSTSSRTVNAHKPEYGERVMQLQHLLPPEAVHKIRQIWNDIYGSGGTARSVDHRSLLSLGSITSGQADRNQPGGSLREHFARRVRQVVRQYLGPNALVSTKQSTSSVPTSIQQSQSEEAKPLRHSSRPDGCSELTVSSCTTISTLGSKASTVIPQPNNRDCTTVQPTGTPTSSSLTVISQGQQSIVVVQSSPGVDESQDSKSQEFMPPLVTSPITATTTCSNPSSLVDLNSKPNSSSESQQVYSQANSSGQHAPPNMCVTDLQAARRASGNSQSCMLEWLLSEEADLGLLPASFYEPKPGALMTISASTAPSVESTENVTNTRSMTSQLSALPPSVPTQYSASSHLPPSSIGSSCDSSGKQPLSIQLPSAISSTPNTFCQSVLVSPVTPTSLASGDSNRALLLCSPTTTITYPPHPSSQLTSNRQSNSMESSPTSAAVGPVSRSNSLLLRLLHPSTPNSVGLGKPRSNSMTSSEPGSPSLTPDSIPRRPSEGGLGQQLILNVRTRETMHSSRLTSPVLDTSASSTETVLGKNKRRRSGPPTPQLSTTMQTFNATTRTRHISQIEMPTVSQHTPAPVSSLTQLLLQEFPSANTSDSSDYDGNKTCSTASSTTSPSYFHLSTFDSQRAQYPEAGGVGKMLHSTTSDLALFSESPRYSSSTPRANIVLSSSAAAEEFVHIIDSSVAVSSLPVVSSFSGLRGQRTHLPPAYTLPSSGTTGYLPTSITHPPHSKTTSTVTPLPTSTTTATPTTEAPSSLCRLLLDPQLGPQNPSPDDSMPIGTLASTPKSSINKAKTVYSSASRSLSSVSPKASSHDVYEFSTGSSESKGSPHSKSTESLSDTVFLDATNPASVSTSHLQPIDIATSYRQSIGSTNSQPLSPKAIAEEVEFLNEILRRDELERSSAGGDQFDTTYSPKAKRSRLDTSTRRHHSGEPNSVHDEDHSLVNGDLGDDSQTDAQAVARICEQLQEGFVSKPSTIAQETVTKDDISVTFSNYSQVLGPTRMPSSSLTFASGDQLPRTNMDLESPHTSSTVSWSPSYTQPLSRLSSGSHRVNQAAVAAARASQEAAASQRTKLANQRQLAEQRKRLLQHQLFNQVTVYSPTPSSNGISPEMIIPPPAMVSPTLRSPTLPPTYTRQPSSSDTEERLVTRRLSGSHQSTPRVSSSTVLGQSSSPSTLHLTATTVVMLTPPTISTSSPCADYYRHCPPEQLSRYLKEVGPNVRVQLSTATSSPGGFLTPLSPPTNLKYGTQYCGPSSSLSVQLTQSFEVSQPIGSNTPILSGSSPQTQLVSPIAVRPVTSVISPNNSEYSEWSHVHSTHSLSPHIPVAISPGGVKSRGRSISSKGGRVETNKLSRASRMNARKASTASCPSSASIDLTQDPPMVLLESTGARTVPSLIQPRLQTSDTHQHNGSTFPFHSPLYSPTTRYSTVVTAVSTDWRVPVATGTAFINNSVPLTNTTQVHWMEEPATHDGRLLSHQRRNNSVPTTPTKYVVGYIPTKLSVITVSPTSESHTSQPSPHMLINHSPVATTPAPSFGNPTNAFLLYPSVEQSPRGTHVLRPTGVSYIYPSQEPSELVVLQPPDNSQLFDDSATTTSVLTEQARNTNCVREQQPPGVHLILPQAANNGSFPVVERNSSFRPPEDYVLMESQLGQRDVDYSTGPMVDTKLEDSLLPEDIINDVFDLETMVVAKQQQQQLSLKNSTTYSTYSPDLHELDAPPDLNTFPSTASSSPSPCSPRLNATMPPDSRSYLSPC